MCEIDFEEEKMMITKVKVKETKISVVLEDDALDALLEAVKANGLHVSKQGFKDFLWDLERDCDAFNHYTRLNGETILVHADDYVDAFKYAVMALAKPNVDCWADGTVQIDFSQYLQFDYKFKMVLVVG